MAKGSKSGMSDGLLTADEVAERLRVSRRTVYDLTAEGLLPAVVLRPSATGRALRRWSRQATDKFIEDAKQASQRRGR